MVCNAHGNATSLRQLRTRFPLSLKGARLSQLVEFAEQLGFRTRALRVELSELDQLALPCILHWDLDHFVVLTGASKLQITVLDPASGAQKLSLDQASRHLTGVVLELTPTTKFQVQKKSESVSVRHLVGPLGALWPVLSRVLMFSLALQVLTVMAPFYMQWVVDQVLVSADRDLLTVLGLGFGLALVLQIGVGLLRGWTVVHVSAQLGLHWAGNVFAHLLRLPLDFFEKRHLGDITSRLGSVQAIQRTLTTSFVETMIDGCMACVTLAMMITYSWKLATITLAAVLVYGLIRAAAFRPVRERAERQLVAAARQQSHLWESLRGMQSLKVAAQESSRRSAYENLMVETVVQEVSLARMNLGFGSASQVVFGLERIAVIWLGASLAMANVFSVGMLIAYLAYKDMFASRTSSLVDKWFEFRMLRLHGERLADIVLTPVESEPEASGDPALPHYAIEVQGLFYRYGDGESWVVEDCSFRIEANESVAITGPSGCGKTTLVKLLLGLLKPSRGSIKVGGIDIHKLGPLAYRQLVAAVMQDDQLFAGSVADNICFFAINVERERIEAAARMAAVDAEIVAMPMGYGSLIGDMGSTLSGGQKQRIVLARALYRQPKILFLDEATSHLDVAGEHLVNDAVRRLGITRVLIAHRPETIASADRVLLMENGRIREVSPSRPCRLVESAP